MRVRLVVALVVTLAACTPGGERDVDRSGVGATATAGAVSISYPPDATRLAMTGDELAAGWDRSFVGPYEAPSLVLTDDRADAGGATDRISLEAIVVDGGVAVAQLALIDGAGDDDAAETAEILMDFLRLVAGDDAEEVFEGLAFGPDGVLFGLSENEANVGEFRFFRASNEDTILIGVVGAP